MGKQGKVFVKELARLFQSYADASTIEVVALQAAMIFPALILQKPHQTSKTRDHINCMERRLAFWHDGNFKALINETQAIQSRINTNRNARKQEKMTTERKFC